MATTVLTTEIDSSKSTPMSSVSNLSLAAIERLTSSDPIPIQTDNSASESAQNMADSNSAFPDDTFITETVESHHSSDGHRSKTSVVSTKISLSPSNPLSHIRVPSKGSNTSTRSVSPTNTKMKTVVVNDELFNQSKGSHEHSPFRNSVHMRSHSAYSDMESTADGSIYGKGMNYDDRRRPETPESKDFVSESVPAYFYSGPIIFALLPSILSMVFGAPVELGDILMLLLLGVYLYYVVKIPWELYYASRVRHSLNHVALHSHPSNPSESSTHRMEAYRRLKKYERFYLLLTLLSPFAGGYVLFLFKNNVSSGSFTFTILKTIHPLHFIFASGIRPVLHLASLARQNILHFQNEVCYPNTEVDKLNTTVKSLNDEVLQLRRQIKQDYITKDVFESCVGKAIEEMSNTPLLSPSPAKHLEKELRRHERKNERFRDWAKDRLNVLESKISNNPGGIQQTTIISSPSSRKSSVSSASSLPSPSKFSSSESAPKKYILGFIPVPSSVLAWILRIWVNWVVTLLWLPITITKRIAVTSASAAKAVVGALMFNDKKMVKYWEEEKTKYVPSNSGNVNSGNKGVMFERRRVVRKVVNTGDKEINDGLSTSSRKSQYRAVDSGMEDFDHDSS